MHEAGERREIVHGRTPSRGSQLGYRSHEIHLEHPGRQVRELRLLHDGDDHGRRAQQEDGQEAHQSGHELHENLEDLRSSPMQ